MGKVVPSSQELILVRDKQVYLTYREDAQWKGWHFPGVNIKPRESLMETAQRIADSEIPGIQITNVELIQTVSATHNPRFHNIILVVKADYKGEPTKGKWFSEFPSDFLEVQRVYIPVLLPYLK